MPGVVPTVEWGLWQKTQVYAPMANGCPGTVPELSAWQPTQTFPDGRAPCGVLVWHSWHDVFSKWGEALYAAISCGELLLWHEVHPLLVKSTAEITLSAAVLVTPVVLCSEVAVIVMA